MAGKSSKGLENPMMGEKPLTEQCRRRWMVLWPGTAWLLSPRTETFVKGLFQLIMIWSQLDTQVNLKSRIKHNYYWEELTHDMKPYVQVCLTCPKNQTKLTNADGRIGTNPNTRTTMEDHYHGPHRAVTNELRTQYDPECCWLTFETPILIALSQNQHHRRSHSIIPERNMVTQRDPGTDHNWSRTSICGSIHKGIILTCENNWSTVNSLSSSYGWSDRKGKPGSGGIPP